MKQLKDTVYDESTDGASPVMPGTYPAHVYSLNTRSFDSGSIVFNLTFRIADEVKDMTVVKQEKNGGGSYEPVIGDDSNPVEVNAGYMSGKTFYAQGVWLTPKPDEGQGWKNRKYKETCENLGVAFNTTKDGTTQLGELEESDVIGAPAFVRLQEQEYTNRNGEIRTAFKVDSILPWNDGTRMSAEELGSDIPF